MPLYEAFTEKYEILEKIGQGGMGAVYRVRHRLLDELRVIKVIRSPLEPTPELTERFLREARTASRLRHPNLALLHDFAVSEKGENGESGADGVAYLVLEHIDGLTLREVLRRFGPAPVEVALEIGRQTCRALEYLHRQRIVHRDISPANLMLTRDSEGRPLVKLIDLGLAKSLETGADGVTTGGVFLGKLRYASPEQFSAELIDERSDLYSLGVVLYELLTGSPPFKGHDPRTWMAAHLFGTPLDFAVSDPEGRVPDDLRALVLRALARNPEERLASAAGFGAALEAIQVRYPLVGDELAPLFEPEVAAVVAEATPPAVPEAEPDAELLLVPAAAPEAAPEDRGDRWDERDRSPEEDAEVTDSLYLVPPPRGGEPEEGALWDAVEAPVVPPGRPPYRKTSFLPAALPVGVMLVLALFMFLKGRSWWNPQVEEPPPVPPMPVAAAPSPPAPLAAPPAPEVEQSVEPDTEPDIEEVVAEAEPLPAPPPKPRVKPNPTPEPKLEPKPEKTEPPRIRKPRETTAKRPAAKPSPRRPEPVRIAEQRSARPAEPRPVHRVAPVARGPMRKGDLIRPGPGVSVPVPLDMPRFAYPAAARGRAGDVDVRLDLLVDERGRVIDAVVREGEPSDPSVHFGFNEVALAAARKVPFQPATRNNIPGKMWTEMIFSFASPTQASR